MKEDILSQKIKRELLNLPIDTEPRVMYLMVEIRKVLEHEGNVRNNILGFYCDWVVHTKLDRFSAQEIYEKIDAGNIESLQIISLTKLRQEIRGFLNDNKLPLDLTDNNHNWQLFMENLVSILIDTPIEKKVDGVVVGSFFYERSVGSGPEFRIIGKKGIKSLGRIIT